MKTLKILITLCFVLGLTSNNSNSQPVREVFENYYVVPFDCMNQNLAGMLTVERITINNHKQIHHYGTLTGQSDGLAYEVKMMTNIQDKGNWIEFGLKAITQTWPANYHIYREGTLVAIIHFSYHYTVNANGEWVSYHGDTFECNLVSDGRF